MSDERRLWSGWTRIECFDQIEDRLRFGRADAAKGENEVRGRIKGLKRS